MASRRTIILIVLLIMSFIGFFPVSVLLSDPLFTHPFTSGRYDDYPVLLVWPDHVEIRWFHNISEVSPRPQDAGYTFNVPPEREGGWPTLSRKILLPGVPRPCLRVLGGDRAGTLTSTSHSDGWPTFPVILTLEGAPFELSLGAGVCRRCLFTPAVHPAMLFCLFSTGKHERATTRSRCRRRSLRRLDRSTSSASGLPRHPARCLGSRQLPLQFWRRNPNHPRNLRSRSALHADDRARLPAVA